MTVSSQTNNETFDGNGVTTIWSLPFRFFSNSDVYAYLVDPVAQTRTLLVLGTNYTLTGAGLPEQFGSAPGKITTTVPVAAGKQLYVERVMAAEQLTDLVNQGRFFAEVHEDVFDKLTMLVQQAFAGIANSLQRAVSGIGWDFLGLRGINVGTPTNASDAATKGYADALSANDRSYADGLNEKTVRTPENIPTLPAAISRANKVMGFDASGNPLAILPASGSGTELAIDLANAVDLSKGAGMVGYRGRPVAARLDDEMSAKSVATLSDLDAVSANKFIPAGSYVFNGANIATIGDIEVSKRAVVANSIYTGILQQDADIAWLQHNHLEFKDVAAPFDGVTSGNVPSAPLYKGQKQSHTNVLAYWYQDFGLEATRAAAGALGSTIWYYWSWLFHGAAGDGYDAKRHPWLGYYRGDDPKVIDWQCYWLNEAGVTGVIIQTRASRSAIRATWATPSDENHWLYHMLNNAPNAKGLTYALWVNPPSFAFTPENRALCEAIFDETLAIYQAYPNCAAVSKNGGIYPTVFTFDGETWRGAFDNFSGTTNTTAFLIAQAAKFQAAGYAGVSILARNGTASFIGSTTLEAGGVIYIDAEYESTNYTPALNGGLAVPVDYEDLAIGVGTRPDGSTVPYRAVAPNISTARESHSAHPSGWTWTGSTPALFEAMCRNVLRRLSQNGNPRILTIYNVSEWAEGGPALQPNMRDGKGYLSALQNALASYTPQIPSTPKQYARQPAQFLSGATSQLVVSDGYTTIPWTVSFAYTSTAAPFIVDPLKYDGKRYLLMFSNTSGHAGPTTLQDISVLPGTKLRLTAATLAFSRNDSIVVEYDATQDVFVQIGALVNVL